MSASLKTINPITKTVAVAFCVVFLFLCAYTFVYNRAEASLRRITLEQIDAHIIQGADELNTATERIISQMQSFRKDPSVIHLSSATELENSDYGKLLTLSSKLKDSFPTAVGTNSCFTRVFLVFDTNEPFLCSSDGIYHNLNMANAASSIGIEGMSADGFLDVIRSSVSSDYLRHLTHPLPVLTLGNTEESFFFVLKYNNITASDVYAVLQINVDLLFDSLMSSCQLGEVAAVFSNRQLLLSTFDVPEQMGHHTYDDAHDTTYLRADLTSLGTQAFVHVSDQSIQTQIQEFTYLLYFLLILAIALFAILFVLACYTLVYPLHHLKNQLNVHGHESFQDFETEYNRIHENLTLIKPALYTALLDKLFHKNYLTPAERAAIQLIPEFPAFEYCRVLVFGTTESDLLTAEQATFLGGVLKDILGRSVVHRLDKDLYAIIHPVEDEEDDSALQSDLELVLCSVQESIPESLFAFGVSETYQGLDSIHIAFEEANNAFREQWSWQQSGIRYHKKSTGQEAYNITLEELDQLYRLLCAGAAEESVRYFETMVDREFGSDFQSCRDQSVCLQFFSDIRGILLRLSSKYDLSAIRLSFISYQEEQQFSHILALLRNALQYVASLASGKEEESESSLAQSIRLYLQENYTDPNLSMASLSELFDMSESTMSRFFKAHMGVTFSTYLENMRLNEAETLLTSTDLSVKDISAMIGYTTPTTFYKAFRRKWGVSPTTHRDVSREV